MGIFQRIHYETMLDSERERIRHIFIKTNQILAQHYFQENNYPQCFEHYEITLDKDPYEEDIYFDYLEILLQ
ncbi:hypothetical protein D4T97_006300 [Siminovitchia acidinfaciens]|uniref:Uncharacterized protein n=1 Tax=Siminovitchia acidinfaciens TaxID=2321395 RepID=A0A429Y4L4_9BACI|nr:hypothetical protein D4T97_006300 [Siminovitchia acidinfaciens]